MRCKIDYIVLKEMRCKIDYIVLKEMRCKIKEEGRRKPVFGVCQRLHSSVNQLFKYSSTDVLRVPKCSLRF